MCMIETCDERYTVYGEQPAVRAKKEHKCTECGRPIARGEIYRRTAGMYDGSWIIGKVCQHCKVATEWLQKNCGGYLDHCVGEDMQAHFDEYSRMDLARIVIGMNHQWKRLRGVGLMTIPKLPRPLKLGDARS
ncbi:MAG: hypothetical protein ACRDHZ_16955 [Ktedonobacteraceae bacterium]